MRRFKMGCSPSRQATDSVEPITLMPGAASHAQLLVHLVLRRYQSCFRQQYQKASPFNKFEKYTFYSKRYSFFGSVDITSVVIAFRVTSPRQWTTSEVDLPNNPNCKRSSSRVVRKSSRSQFHKHSLTRGQFHQHSTSSLSMQFLKAQ